MMHVRFRHGKYIGREPHDEDCRPLNEFLVFVLWGTVLLNLAALVLPGFSRALSTIWDVADALLRAALVVGAFLVLRLRRVGFFLMVGSIVLSIPVSYFALRERAMSGEPVDMGNILWHQAIVCVAQIVFLAGNMLMNNNNNRNAYDVLWADGEENEE